MLKSLKQFKGNVLCATNSSKAKKQFVCLQA